MEPEKSQRLEEAEGRIIRLLERSGGLPEALRSQGLPEGAARDPDSRSKICQAVSRDFMADHMTASRRYGMNSLESMREVSGALSERAKAMRSKALAARPRQAESAADEERSFSAKLAARRGLGPEESAFAPARPAPGASASADKARSAIASLAAAPSGARGSLLDRVLEDVRRDAGLKDHFSDAKVSYRGAEVSAAQARNDLANRGLLRDSAGDFNQQAGVTKTAEGVSREARERMASSHERDLSGLIGIPKASALRRQELERDLFEFRQQSFDHERGLRPEAPEMPRALQSAVLRQAARDPSIAAAAGLRADAAQSADLGLGMSREHMEIRKAVAEAVRELPARERGPAPAESRQEASRERLGFGQARQGDPERKNTHSLGPEARAEHARSLRALLNGQGQSAEETKDQSRGR